MNHEQPIELIKSYWERYTEAYDNIIGNYSRHRELVELHAELLRGAKKILESGSGPGHLTKELLEDDHEVFALDINVSAIQRLKKKCGDAENLHALVGDGSDLPFPDNSFDGVSSMLVLWSIKNPAKYLQEHYRVLKPGGIFVLSGPSPKAKEDYRYHLDEIEKDLRAKGIFEKLKSSWDTFIDYTEHNVGDTGENWYEDEQIKELLEKVGFEILSIQPNPIYVGQGHVILARK